MRFLAAFFGQTEREAPGARLACEATFRRT
jgi:hypothetical protein